MAAYVERSAVSLCLEILKDPDRKSLVRIIYEAICLMFVQRELPVHYFSRYLFKKHVRNIRDFIPNRLLGYKITPNFNDNKAKEVLDNKLFFDFYYRQFDLPVPQILMYNFRNMFVLAGKVKRINNPEEFTDLLEKLFDENKNVGSVIIKKTVAGSCGTNIFKLYGREVREKEALVKRIFNEVIKTGFLFQKTLVQHPDLDNLNPSCLNTVRIDTFIDKDGNSEVISAYLRMSISNNFIDNISSGGCQVGIDTETGKLKEHGYAPFRSVGVTVFEKHPVTGLVFRDFQLPFFEKVRELAVKTSQCMPALRLVGWDIAICRDGPVLVEGNSDYDINGNDLAYGGYFRNPVFRKVLREINYPVRNDRSR
ncbi:MAG TPA: sugar-transfer associated ATP-grasp domain-containing protein [Bacteroidales bacterium]|nr:sugar-transfer associated ATP-grasp domain-containing protein [Bacteroidales bacterium]